MDQGEMKFLLVVYDISNDQRRTKLHDLLLDYGSPVQYSVFECILDDDAIARMKKMIKRVIRPRKDNVRIYSLCEACLAKTEITCGPELLSKPAQVVVV